MRRAFAIFAWACLLLGSLVPGTRAGVASGTSIDNQAGASYFSASGVATSSISNTVQVIAAAGPAQANLTLTKSVSTPTANPGDQITYTLAAANVGTGDAAPVTVAIDGANVNKIVVRDIIPSNTKFASFVALGGSTPLYHTFGTAMQNYVTVAPSDISTVDAVAFALDKFPAGASASFKFSVSLNSNAAGTISNTAVVYFNKGSDTFTNSNTVVVTASGPSPIIGFFTNGGFSQPAPVGSAGQPLYIQTNAAACNVNPAVADTVQITVSAALTGDIETFPAIETGPNTGIFQVLPAPPTLNAVSNPVVPGNKIMEVLNGDTVTAVLKACGTTSVNATLLIDPTGVVFDSRSNQTVGGAIVTLIDLTGQGNGGNPGQPAKVLTADGATPAASTVTTASDGRFEFLYVLPSTYKFSITPPTGFAYPSTIAIGQLPAGRTVDASASYGMNFVISAAGPVRFDQPVDLKSTGLLLVEKTVARPTALVGDFLDYTIQVKNTSSIVLNNVQVSDTLPRGFVYQLGTTRINGVGAPNPSGGKGPNLVFTLAAIPANSEVDITYRVQVGATAGMGGNPNFAFAAAGATKSNSASATVQILGGAFSSEGYVIGRVFADCNGNGKLDVGESGIPGVRVLLEDQTSAITDIQGKYSIYGVTPLTHIVKIDPVTLPEGYEGEILNHRNAGDPNSMFVDMKNGQMFRADFATSCSPSMVSEIAERSKQQRQGFVEAEAGLGANFTYDTIRRGTVEAKAAPSSGIVGRVPGADVSPTTINPSGTPNSTSSPSTGSAATPSAPADSKSTALSGQPEKADAAPSAGIAGHVSVAEVRPAAAIPPEMPNSTSGSFTGLAASPSAPADSKPTTPSAQPENASAVPPAETVGHVPVVAVIPAAAIPPGAADSTSSPSTGSNATPSAPADSKPTMPSAQPENASAVPSAEIVGHVPGVDVNPAAVIPPQMPDSTGSSSPAFIARPSAPAAPKSTTPSAQPENASAAPSAETVGHVPAVDVNPAAVIPPQMPDSTSGSSAVFTTSPSAPTAPISTTPSAQPEKTDGAPSAGIVSRVPGVDVNPAPAIPPQMPDSASGSSAAFTTTPSAPTAPISNTPSAQPGEVSAAPSAGNSTHVPVVEKSPAAAVPEEAPGSVSISSTVSTATPSAPADLKSTAPSAVVPPSGIVGQVPAPAISAGTGSAPLPKTQSGNQPASGLVGFGVQPSRPSKTLLPGRVNETVIYPRYPSGGCVEIATQAAMPPNFGLMDPAPMPQPLALASVFYPTNYPMFANPKIGLVPSQQATLSELAANFKRYLEYDTTARLLIVGHADSRGAKQHNVGLKKRRANLSKKVLVSLGVPAERIETRAADSNSKPLSREEVVSLLSSNPARAPAFMTRQLRATILAYNRRADINLEPTGQESARTYPLASPDARILWQPTMPSATAVVGGNPNFASALAGITKLDAPSVVASALADTFFNEGFVFDNAFADCGGNTKQDPDESEIPETRLMREGETHGTEVANAVSSPEIVRHFPVADRFPMGAFLTDMAAPAESLSAANAATSSAPSDSKTSTPSSQSEKPNAAVPAGVSGNAPGAEVNPAAAIPAGTDDLTSTSSTGSTATPSAPADSKSTTPSAQQDKTTAEPPAESVGPVPGAEENPAAATPAGTDDSTGSSSTESNAAPSAPADSKSTTPSAQQDKTTAESSGESVGPVPGAEENPAAVTPTGTVDSTGSSSTASNAAPSAPADSKSTTPPAQSEEAQSAPSAGAAGQVPSAVVSPAEDIPSGTADSSSASPTAFTTTTSAPAVPKPTTPPAQPEKSKSDSQPAIALPAVGERPLEPLEALLQHLEPELGFINVKDNEVMPYTQTPVRVKGPVGAIFKLYVNDVEVTDKEVGKKVIDSEHQVEAWEFIGVDLKPGHNSLRLVQLDPFGNQRGAELITLIAPKPLRKLRIDVPKQAEADGKTLVQIAVHPLDADDVPVMVPVEITLESTDGEWQVKDVDPTQPGIQVYVKGGEAFLPMLSPSDSGTAKIRISSGPVHSEAQLAFVPALRPMIAAGVVDEILSFRNFSGNSIAPVQDNDGFEEELRALSISNASGTTQLQSHVGLSLKGKVKGAYLLTLAYDSDKTNERLFRDIQPDEFYPVYGDSSVRGYDAQSTSRAYLRVDKGRSYILYGDFATTENDSTRVLTVYNRSLTGMREHYQNDRVNVTTFASHDTFSQHVQEIPANGTSGPYILANSNGVINGETIQIIVRDRNQPALILKITPETRFVDYELEPYSGEILFTSPVPSLDENLNPISIRVTYEMDQGGARFWVAGVDGSVKLVDRVRVGGTYVADLNPGDQFFMKGFNSSVQLDSHTTLNGEFALTHRDTVGDGDGFHFELLHESEKLKARAYFGRTTPTFDNINSLLNQGRGEGGLKLSWSFTPSTRLVADAIRSEDTAAGGTQMGALVSVEHTLKNRAQVEVGMRYVEQGNLPASLSTEGSTNTTTTSVRTKLTVPVPRLPRLQVYGEYEQDVHDLDKKIAALGGTYQLFERAKIYVRHELISSLGNEFALNTTQQQQASVVGIDGDYLKNTHVFSEYRDRDDFSGRETEAAIGLRNTWAVRSGLRLISGIESVKVLKGVDATNNLALISGVDYTPNSRLKGTSRFEWRASSNTRGYLSTLGAAVKISQNWTFLGRNVLSTENSTSGPQNDQFRERAQMGFAFRDSATSSWNWLGMTEFRSERTLNSTAPTARRFVVFSSNVNYEPSRSLVLSARYASKFTVDKSLGLDSSAGDQLASLRMTYDLAKHWDMGFLVSTMFSNGFSSRQYSAGPELGRLVMKNLWASVGYNVLGYHDTDLSGENQMRRGTYVRIRFKFDESLLEKMPGANSK